MNVKVETNFDFTNNYSVVIDKNNVKWYNKKTIIDTSTINGFINMVMAMYAFMTCFYDPEKNFEITNTGVDMSLKKIFDYLLDQKLPYNLMFEQDTFYQKREYKQLIILSKNKHTFRELFEFISVKSFYWADSWMESQYEKYKEIMPFTYPGCASLIITLKDNNIDTDLYNINVEFNR